VLDAITKRIVFEVELQAIILARMQTGIQLLPSEDEHIGEGVAIVAAAHIGDYQLSPRDGGVERKDANADDGDAGTWHCGLYEDPEAGVASPAWTYRGPVAEAQAQAQAQSHRRAAGEQGPAP